GEVLEVAPAQRGALDVDAGPEHHRHVLGPRLLAECLADTAHKVGVPGGSEPARGRKARGRDAAGDADVVAFLGLLAQPVRAVGDHDRRYAEPWYRCGVPEIRAQTQGRLLVQGQLAE